MPDRLLLWVAEADSLSMWPEEKINQTEHEILRNKGQHRPRELSPPYFHKGCFSPNVREELDVLGVFTPW